MNIQPRLAKKTLLLICCAFALGYGSSFYQNHASLQQGQHVHRNLKGIHDFVEDVLKPFIKALRKKFQAVKEEIPDYLISLSPTPLNLIEISAEDARLILPTPAPTPAPTYLYTKEPDYLTSDVQCGGRRRWYSWYWSLYWSMLSPNHIEYNLFNQDGSDFDIEKAPGMKQDILEATKQSLTNYWQCREDNGHYDKFLHNLYLKPVLTAQFIQNTIRIACYDACTGSVMCFDLTVPKVDDECLSDQEDYQNILPDPDAKLFPKFDYKMEYDVGGEGDEVHQTYEYNVDTLEANPVKRDSYGAWIKMALPEAEANEQKEKLKELFDEWNVNVDESKFENVCDDIHGEGHDVECTLGYVSYLDVSLGNDVGFAMRKLKNFKENLSVLRMDMNAEKEFPDFSQFTQMKMLDINANEKLDGNLPTTIGSLSKLISLEINSAGLDGSLPTEIGQLNKLILLDLGNNGFNGEIPDEFYNLHKLKAFYFHKNELTGTISTRIGELRKLKQISLQDNDFHGTFPTEVNQLNDLRVFDLQRGGFSGPFPDITSLKELKVVALNGNGFNGKIPENIGDLTNLQFLNLRNNQLTGTVPASLVNCRKLKRLVLDGNPQLTISDDLLRDLITNGGEDFKVSVKSYTRFEFQSARQSSTMPSHSANKAKDGDRNGDRTQTTVEDDPWWEGTLPNTVTIYKVKIFNRNDDIRAFRVLIKDENDVELYSSEGRDPGKDEYEIFVPAVRGRKVEVQLFSRGYLSLSEVEVYGTD